jgi:DNA-binding NtrC family response regulator
MREGNEITAGDIGLPAQVRPLEDLTSEALLDLPLTEAKARLVESFQRRAILRALEKQGGNISAAARALGIHRQSLQQKMTQLSISRPERAGRED